MVWYDPLQSFIQAQAQKKQSVTNTDTKQPVSKAEPKTAIPTNVWWFGYQIWSIGSEQTIAALTKKQKSQSIGRVIPKNPSEDKEILGASFDMLNWATSEEISKAYPTITAKLPALASYLSDAYDPRVDERKLYDAYPELSEDVKVNLRAQIKPEVEKQIAQQELDNQWLTAVEKWEAWVLWVATWAGNVWYNLGGGKQINQLWAWIWEKLKNTEFADLVRSAGEKVFGKEEMKAYQEQQKLAKVSPDQFSAENQANILRTVGWRKLEQSWRGKTGKTIWEQAAITALTLPAGWIIAEWANALRGVTWAAKVWGLVGKVGSIARWALAGGATGVVEAEAQTIWTEWRLATGKELKTGATIWAIAWGVFAKKISPTEKTIANKILPKMTPAVEAERALQWLTKTNALGKVIPILSKDEQEMVQMGKKIISPSKSNVWNLNKAKSVAKSEWTKLKSMLSKNKKFAWATNDVINEMDKVDIPPLLKSDATLSKAYDIVKEQFRKILDNTPKTAEWLLDARQEFDYMVSKSFPNLYSSDTLTPIKSAITSLRKIPNEMLNSGIWDDLVKKSLRKQSLLLDMVDNLSTKVEKTWTTKIGRTITANKDLLKAASYLWGLWYGWYELWKAVWWAQ